MKNPNEEWSSSGKRVKRGLFRTASNHHINADCNGSANIIRKAKVSKKSSLVRGMSLDGLSMGSLIAPQRIKIWSAKKKLPNVDLSHCVESA